MKKEQDNSRLPLEKYTCYVVAITTVERVLARSGKEATDLAVAKVRRALGRLDGRVYIPGVTTIRGQVTPEVLEDIKAGRIPGLMPEAAGSPRRVKGPKDIDPKCRNCGHDRSLHMGNDCHGQAGIPCFCLTFEGCLPGEEDIVRKQGEGGMQEVTNKLRRGKRIQAKNTNWREIFSDRSSSASSGENNDDTSGAGSVNIEERGKSTEEPE